VHLALTSCYDHLDELVARLNEGASSDDCEALKQPLSRAGLLMRRSTQEP